MFAAMVVFLLKHEGRVVYFASLFERIEFVSVGMFEGVGCFLALSPEIPLSVLRVFASDGPGFCL